MFSLIECVYDYGMQVEDSGPMIQVRDAGH